MGDAIVNAGATKLDYYLERTVVYSARVPRQREHAHRHPDEHRTAATARSPRYVDAPRNRLDGEPAGTNRDLVTLYVPWTLRCSR